MSQSIVTSATSDSNQVQVQLPNPVPEATVAIEGCAEIQLPPLPRDKDAPEQTPEAKVAERLKREIAEFERVTGRKFDEELSAWKRKDGDRYVLDDDRVEAVKGVLRRALGLPKGYDINLYADANGDARYDGTLRGELVFRDKVTMDLHIERGTGVIWLDRNRDKFATLLDWQRRHDVAAVVGRYPKEVERWHITDETEGALSMHTRRKVLDEFASALGLPAGSLAGLKLTQPAPNAIDVSLRAPGGAEVTKFTSTITVDPKTKSAVAEYKLSPITIPEKRTTGLPPLPGDKKP